MLPPPFSPLSLFDCYRLRHVISITIFATCRARRCPRPATTATLPLAAAAFVIFASDASLFDACRFTRYGHAVDAAAAICQLPLKVTLLLR